MRTEVYKTNPWDTIDGEIFTLKIIRVEKFCVIKFCGFVRSAKNF